MGNENPKETPPPYDPNGKGFVGEGKRAPEAPLRDKEKDDEKAKD